MLLFFYTSFPLRTIIDLIDKAILYLYLGDKVAELRQHGINGVIELVAIVRLADHSPVYQDQNGKEEPELINTIFRGIDMDKLIAHLSTVVGQTPEEFKAFIYNLYYDPLVSFIYDIWGRCLNLDQKLPADEDMESIEESHRHGDMLTFQPNPTP